MDQGYVKLWRKTIKSQVFQNEGLFKVWAWCLMKASYKDRCIGFKTGKGGIEVNIGPGQFVFGRRSAAEELKMDPNTIWKRMQKLKNLQNITLESNQQYTLVSINNWHTYQEDIPESNRESNQQVTTKYPASNTNNKDKKDKKNTYSPEFVQFYAAYPKKKDPDRAWKAWKSRNGDMPDVSVIIDAINRQKQSPEWKKENGRFIPYPATWLNAGSWKNEEHIDSTTTKRPIIVG